MTDLRLIPSNPPGIDLVYQIKENPDQVQIPIPNVAYEPEACQYSLKYEAKLLNGGELPSFIEFDPMTGFDILTNNPDHVGTFQI